jgi:hypothetical protein
MDDRAGYELDARVRAAEADFAQVHFLPVLYAIRHTVEEAQARVSRARQHEQLQRILSERAAEYRESQANGEPNPFAGVSGTGPCGECASLTSQQWNPLLQRDAIENESDQA